MLAVALDQAERIRQSVAASFAARDLYTEKQVAALVGSLREAEKRIKADLLRYPRCAMGCLGPILKSFVMAKTPFENGRGNSLLKRLYKVLV